jgi:3-dehydroquinate dehydratase-2
MIKILLMNGPNLNMLSIREPGIYGTETLETIEAEFAEYARARGCSVDTFQSNHEGALIDRLHAAHNNYDGIVYNPGAHTHYSYALHDAVAAINVPVVEVHLSDISKREEFRRVSVIEPACVAQVAGKGKAGYMEALDILLDRRN